VLTPNLLELKVINTAPFNSDTPSSLNLVDGSFTFAAPLPGIFAVTATGPLGLPVVVPVQAVGFKRRPFFAPLQKFDPAN